MFFMDWIVPTVLKNSSTISSSVAAIMVVVVGEIAVRNIVRLNCDMILTFYERNGLICTRKNGITREREEGSAQICMKKGFKIESLHDTNKPKRAKESWN